MNQDQQFTLVAADDLLWVYDGISWPTDKDKLANLIEDPAQFFVDNDVFVKCPSCGTAIHPEVPPPFWVLIQGARGAQPSDLCVQGIHQTSIMTVRSKVGSGFIGIVKIPDDSRIQISLVAENGVANLPKKGRAYGHWEINSPKTPTTPDILANHVVGSLSEPVKIVDNYQKRIKDKQDVDIRFVNKKGEKIGELSKDQKLYVNYSDLDLNVLFNVSTNTGGMDPELVQELLTIRAREILCQGFKADKDAMLDPTPPLSCNVDIGNYYTLPNGVIVVVTDSTIVKLY